MSTKSVKKIYMADFKEGDIVTLVDELDPAIAKHGRSFYRIMAVYPDSYAVYSFRHDSTITREEMSERLQMAQIHYYRDGHPDEIHIGKHGNVKEWVNEGYRLATEAEIVLYVKKKNK